MALKITVIQWQLINTEFMGLEFSMAYQNLCVIQQSYVKSHLGATEILCDIRLRVRVATVPQS